MSNLRCHGKNCWGEKAIAAADATGLHGAACEIIDKSLRMLNGSIIAMFERVKGRGKVTYSHQQHTKTEARYVPICLWSFPQSLQCPCLLIHLLPGR